jgi:SAM-dependent methyltransferase
VSAANADQIEFWNSDEATHWVRDQARYDEMLAPFTDALLERAALPVDADVLDIGCGTGFTTRAAARRTPEGRATGVDVSEPMIAAARALAQADGLRNVDFSVGDAQTASFAADHAAVISRFGVMFFDDPVAAFTNLRTALRPDGQLTFVCWQPMLDNEWMAVPLMAVLAHVSPPAPADPSTPGPFSLGERDRIVDVLGAAGFGEVTVEPGSTPILVGGPGSVAEAVAFMRATGMGRLLLADREAPGVRDALDAIATALEPHHDGEGVRLGSATWLVTARA